MKNTLLTVTSLLLAGALVGSSSEAEDAHPDLTGRWVLNEAMSENALDKMRELRSQGLVGRGGFGGPPGRTGRGGELDTGSLRRGRRARAGGLEGDRRGLAATIDEGVDSIEIRESGDELSLIYSDDRLRILFTDGRKDKRVSPLGDVVTTAKWRKGGELVVKSQTELGRTTEVYRLDVERDRLLVDVTLDTRMGQVTFYRTYDRAPQQQKQALEPS